MKKCPKCKTDHEKPGIFCSRSCANSKTFTEESKFKRRKLRYCTRCNTGYYPKIRETFCSAECKDIHETNRSQAALIAAEVRRVARLMPRDWEAIAISRSVELVESGEVCKLSEPNIRRHMRRYLIQKHGHKCSICEITEWGSQPVPLVCDHIDGDSTNSQITNFRLVCCNCDALLDTYKSKNRGQGRKYDREYHQRTKQKQTD